MVQRLFVALWSRQPPDAIVARQPSEFSLSDLRAWGRPFYSDAKAFLRSVTPARLAEPLIVPWAATLEAEKGRYADGAHGGGNRVPGGEPHDAPPRPGQRAAARSGRGAAARGLHRLGVVRAAGTGHGTVIALTDCLDRLHAVRLNPRWRGVAQHADCTLDRLGMPPVGAAAHSTPWPVAAVGQRHLQHDVRFDAAAGLRSRAWLAGARGRRPAPLRAAALRGPVAPGLSPRRGDLRGWRSTRAACRATDSWPWICCW